LAPAEVIGGLNKIMAKHRARDRHLFDFAGVRIGITG
jgi:hypothetical protein